MNNEKWLKHYRTNKSAVWIKVRLKNGQEFFCDDSSIWKGIKVLCEKKNTFLEEFSLQFRSHEIKIDLEDLDGIYFVRSIMGQVGAESKHYYTVGTVKGDEVHKRMWLIPELVAEKDYVDDISECFTEAIIYDETKKKNREEQI